METCNLPGQPVPAPGHPHSEKNVSPCSGGTSHVSVCAHYLLLCHWAPLKRLYSSSLLPPFRYSYTLIWSPWCSFSLFFLSSSRSLCPCITGELLKPPKHLSGPYLDSMSTPLFYWGAQNLIQYFRCGLNSTWIISNATESIPKTKAPKNYEWSPKTDLSSV